MDLGGRKSVLFSFGARMLFSHNVHDLNICVVSIFFCGRNIANYNSSVNAYYCLL